MSALVVSSTTVGRWIVRAEHVGGGGVSFRVVHTTGPRAGRSSLYVNQRDAARAARVMNRRIRLAALSGFVVQRGARRAARALNRSARS